MANDNIRREWCFTINGDKWDWIPYTEDERMRYMVINFEKGEKTGHYHWQGYIEFNQTMRLEGVKEFLGVKWAHVEARMGTRDQARKYCMKSDTQIDGPFEFGHWNKKGQGHRSDHEAVASDIKEHGLIKAIDMHPGHYLRFHGGMHKYSSHLSRNKKRKVTVCYGEYEDGMYCLQQGDSLREQFAHYDGEDTIYVPDGISRRTLETGLPLVINNRYASWTKVVYEKNTWGNT